MPCSVRDARVEIQACRRAEVAVVILILLQTSMLAWSAYRHSPVVSEVGHLPAGISHWRFLRFDLYRVNPPLVRMVAAVPVLFVSPATDWSKYSVDPLSRKETPVGIDFVEANGSRTFLLYTLGRLACIPFSWIGAWVCYRWARDLYGPLCGTVAAALWCFCPNILGNGALLMPDMPAAALTAAACYAFWRWLKYPAWTQSVAFGVILGFAELSKTTLLVLYPLWPLLWIAYRLPDRRKTVTWEWARQAAFLLSSIAISMNLINLGYAFEGSFASLGSYTFQSSSLTGAVADNGAHRGGNRFAGTWLGSVPVPLPRNYVQGIDAQKVDFENGMDSYLSGEWRERGWWYFYLYALAMKVPLGTFALIGLASVVAVIYRRRAVGLRDEMLVFVPAIVILVVVSAQTGFSIHCRYVLPIFPFMFVWASRAALAITSRRIVLAALVVGALAWSILSSLWYFPHSLSYFNEIVGGAKHGPMHLLDSGSAWGQDILYLKEWYDVHPEARPFHLAAFGLVDPRVAGIEFALPPLGPSKANANERLATSGPQPGWYAIDVNYLHGSKRGIPKGNGLLAAPWQSDLNLEYFRRFRPIASVAYSIHIFCLSTGEVNIVRRELGLPPLGPATAP